jgi:hypothetical protein
MVLVENGVDADIEDCAGMRAVDSAKDIERDQEERERNCLYRETTETGKLRKEIVEVSQKPVAERTTHRRDTHFDKFGKTDFPMAISHLAPIATIEVQRLSKTVACLDEGLQLPHAYALSGWAHPGETATRLPYWKEQSGPRKS